VATPAMVRAYGRMGGPAPAVPVQAPYVPTPYSSEEMAEAFAVNWARNLGYKRVLDSAVRVARQTRFVP
jgi:hypothetical protein